MKFLISKNFENRKPENWDQTYITSQQVRLSRQNDGENLALGQCLAERQHQMISNGFHHLHGAGELIVGQV